MISHHAPTIVGEPAAEAADQPVDGREGHQAPPGRSADSTIRRAKPEDAYSPPEVLGFSGTGTVSAGKKRDGNQRKRQERHSQFIPTAINREQTINRLVRDP